MGRVASRGIAFGKIVPVDGLIESPEINSIDGFSGLLLRRFGFDAIGKKIADQKPLTFEEIRMLYTDAPMSVLMKLVQLRGATPVEKSLLPMVAQSFEDWLTGADDLSEAREQLENVHCFISEIDPDAILSMSRSEVARINLRYPGGQFVADSAEVLYAAVGESRYYFEELLQKLRGLGFARMLPTQELDLCRSLYEAGFPVEIATDISYLASPEMFAEEYFRLNMQCQSEKVEVWEPITLQKGSESVGMHFKLLRALALGTLCIRVPRRRASSAYFSPAAFDLVGLFGANEFGYAALDESSERALSLGRYDVFGSRIPQQYL